MLQQPTLQQLCHIAGHGRSWGLGISLGSAITAAGIETPEQLERVRVERCTEVQS